MNKLKEQINYSKFVETKSVILDLDYAERLLLVLEEFLKEPTLDECIKEWEEKNFIVSLCEGYLFIKKYSTHWQDCVIVISIDINGKEYKTEDDFYITFELHNLLSKTLKALEVKKNVLV